MAGGDPRPPPGVGCGPARIDLAWNRPARCSPSPTRSTALGLQSAAGASVINEARTKDGDCFNVCLANPVADPDLARLGVGGRVSFLGFHRT